MQSLLGIWTLLFVNYTANPAEVPYYGPQAVGRIIITESHFSATITDLNRTTPLPPDQRWRTAADDVVAQNARPMVAYAGPYRLEEREGGEVLTHTDIKVSLNPSWQGTDQVRMVEWKEFEGREVLSLWPINVSLLWICLCC